MTALIFNFLRNHWLGTVVSAFAIGIAAKLSLQQVEIGRLHKSLNVCSAENITLEASNKALVNSVQSQNEAVVSMQAEAAKKIKAAAHALVIAKANAKKYALAAQQLKTQTPTGNECSDMRSLVENYIKTVP